MEKAAGFGVENHADGGSVFDAATGVEEFQLGEDGCGWCGGEASELQHGGVPHQLGYV
jgi:hypothetical protein